MSREGMPIMLHRKTTMPCFLELVQTHESIEDAVSDLYAKMDIDINIDDFSGAIDIFTHPAVSQDYIIETGKLDTDMIMDFLCDTHGFSKEHAKNRGAA